ncbi:MAG: glycosyltransferase, partial [Alphaproteobacteria bacterium]
DIAVNPTLSEGGCPFTFTEALSVGTPVVMSRIPVAQEILSDEKLSRLTFFDPYSWKDCANRIEWAVHNRQKLLEVQKVAYQALSGRTWSDVVREHVDVLEKIAVRAQSRL